MAVDGKYGEVVLEHGDVGEDEPVVVFRAKDKNLPQVLQFYYDICRKSGSPDRHLELIKHSHDSISQWQADHPDDVRTPTSENSRTWMEI